MEHNIPIPDPRWHGIEYDPEARRLYHYTSLTGLQGIVEERAIRASHYAYLSDYSEVRYGLEIIRAYIRELWLGSMSFQTSSDPADEDIEIIGRELTQWLRDGFPIDHNRFVCCFSKSGNLLSQWRSYTPPNKGICLGFDHDRLLDLMKRQGFDVCECEYDAGTQYQQAEEIAHEIVNHAMQVARPSQSSSARSLHWLYPVFEQFTDRVLKIAIRMKHPKYSEEAELRFISPKLDGEEFQRRVRFSEGRASLVPYIHFEIKMTEDDTWPLKEVMVGPTPYTAASRYAVSTFLDASKIGDVRVTECEIPFRG